MRHVIIGAGPAALSAAKRIRSLRPEDEVKILSKERVRPYSKMALPYILCGETTLDGSLLSVPEGVDLLLGEEALRVDVRDRFVETKSGKRFHFDTLLIASGADPVSPDVKSSLSFTVRNIEDIERIKDAALKHGDKPVILVGAGLVNMEVADALSKMGIPFTFVVRSDRLLSQIMDKDGASVLERIVLSLGCKVFKGEDVVDIEEVKSGVLVRLTSGQVIEGSCVVFGKGVRPSVSMLEGAGIKVNRGVVVNDYLMTNIDDIYAAGDVAETKDIVFGDIRLHALWPLAIEQGRIAGSNMAGLRERYRGSVSRNIATLFGRTVFTGGMSVEDRFDIIRINAPDRYVKVALRDGMLKGFIFIGEVNEPGAYIYAMEREIDIKRLLDKVLDGSLTLRDLHRKVYFSFPFKPG